MKILRGTLRGALVAHGAVLAISGCRDAGGEPAARAEAWDSAGIRIVRSAAAASDAPLPWSVSERPSLEIGGGEGAQALFQVAGAARLAGGGVVVANAGSHELRMYDADGKHLRSIGREGGGPGEFRNLAWAGVLPGDTIAAWDAGLARLSFFTPDGRFVRAVTPSRPLGLFPQAIGLLPDRSLVTTAGMTPKAMGASGVWRDSTALLVIAPDGSRADTLGRFPRSEQYVKVGGSVGFFAHTLPFAREIRVALAGGRVLLSTAEAYEIAEHAPGGEVRRIVRIDRAPVEVTPEDVEEYRENLVTLGAPPAMREAQRALLDEMPFPRTMPALTDLKTDPLGYAWIEEPRQAGDPGGRTWRVLGPDGRARGTVRLPRDLAVREIGRDYVLGTALGEDGTERVRLHLLRR